MDLKKLLNKEQYEAATTIEGQVLILAGAGSGKTRVLTHRIAYMIEDKGIAPYNILAIPFTNKAAGEMKERVKALIGDEAENMWISTFHSSCVRILRREIEKLGYKKDFTIYDSYDQKSLVKQCMKELNINDKDIEDREVLSKIGKAKDDLKNPSSVTLESQGNYREEKIAQVYELYQKKLKQNNALDFDDLIFKTVDLFRKEPEVLEFYQRKFRYIMVDEYQDTNKAQYEFIKLLAKKFKNICVVGDDDQCLAEGTLLRDINGEKKVESLEANAPVIGAAGRGETVEYKIDKIKEKEYSGPIIKIDTEGGRSIKATPNHMVFGKVNSEKGLYYVYLMYKNGFGYRIGQTSSLRSRDGEMVNGLFVRLNGEKADKIWILKVCKDKKEASYYEQYFSSKYGIPTVVFYAKGRNITLEQEDINKLFKEINTYDAADRLMEENFISNEYPHHTAGAIIRGETSRKAINISFFGGKKGNEKGYYSHRISLNTSGEEERGKCDSLGFNTRKGQRNTWRVETERAVYDDAEYFAKKLSQVENAYYILRKARLTEDESYNFMPIGSLKEGMGVPVYDEGKIVDDKVANVSVINYEGKVYDIDVPHLRQYVANEIVVHNCIYAWRGADIRNILDFEKDYPECKTVKLEQNYRSMGNILEAANFVIKNNSERKSKILRTEAEKGEKIKIYRAFSDMDESNFAATTIENGRKEDRKYRDFAVLYRTNAQSRIFEDTFIKRGIPYRLIGGLKFYDRKEIKDILAYLKVINNPADSVNLRRIINVPKRSIGDATVDKVLQFAADNEMSLFDSLIEAENISSLTPRNVTVINKFTALMEELIEYSESMPISNLIEDILKNTGYLKELKESNNPEDLSRVENLEELVSAAVDFEKNEEDNSLAAFLEKVALVQDVDNFDQEADSVTLMTLHSAKGLEFPVVFMVGMENGLFPGASSFNSESEMEESRRLCYVGITRAREFLYMTSAEVRRVFGRTVAYPQSDFIAEIPTELREYVNVTKHSGTLAGGKSAYANYNISGGNPHTLRNSYGNNASKGNKFISSAEATKKLNNILNEDSEKMLTKGEATLGRKVKHPKFGIGTIVKAIEVDDDVKITIAFDSQGIKTLLLSMASLELL